MDSRYDMSDSSPWFSPSSPPASPDAISSPFTFLAGVLLYLSCVRAFATRGRGAPGIWDAPRRVVTAGPYRWVRNPIYIGPLLIVAGEAWLFLSVDLLLYAGTNTSTTCSCWLRLRTTAPGG